MTGRNDFDGLRLTQGAAQIVLIGPVIMARRRLSFSLALVLMLAAGCDGKSMVTPPPADPDAGDVRDSATAMGDGTHRDAGQASDSRCAEPVDAGLAKGGPQALDAATKLPACSWPASLDPSDAGSRGQCVAGRAYLSCAGSNGGGEDCLSDDLTQCPGPNATPGVTYSNCKDLCDEDEYAAICGTVGPPPADASMAAMQPPSGCRMVAANPGGAEPYCCPCGT